MSFFDMTVKLSAAPLCMITLIPVIKLIKDKKYARILMYGCIVMIILLPYFIRNYYISGWLLYPSVAIDIFDPEWKITRESAMADSAYIVAFGRGFSNIPHTDIPCRIRVQDFPQDIRELQKNNRLHPLRAAP